MCLYPKLGFNKKYLANKKNNRNPPVMGDSRVKFVPYGCGKCMECCKQKSREWLVRLSEDIKYNTNGVFVTLTFSNEEYSKLYNEVENRLGYEIDNEICRLAVRRFCGRWRKKYGHSPRHWLISEIGHKGTENIHMHGIIWCDKDKDIAERWGYGFVWLGDEKNGKLVNYVNGSTINYITKYMTKRDELNVEYKAKVFNSAGIGIGYIENARSNMNGFNYDKTREFYITESGHKIALPIYYRNKLYSEDEREILWLQKLDKEERWVGGEKVDISENENNYYELLKYYRGINKGLGYGSDEINWEQKYYDNYRRHLRQRERVNDGIRKLKKKNNK